MYLPPIIETISLALLWLTPTPTPDLELPYLHGQDPSPYPVVRDDLRCPRGYSPSFLHNTYTYYGPLKEFTDITGSFYRVQWYVRNISAKLILVRCLTRIRRATPLSTKRLAETTSPAQRAREVSAAARSMRR
jgi:hypothetical protein